MSDETNDTAGVPEDDKGTYTNTHEDDVPAEAGSFTGTHESGVEYDGAFTDSEIPADDIKPGETEVDKAGFEGGYTDGE